MYVHGLHIVSKYVGVYKSIPKEFDHVKSVIDLESSNIISCFYMVHTAVKPVISFDL